MSLQNQIQCLMAALVFPFDIFLIYKNHIYLVLIYRRHSPLEDIATLTDVKLQQHWRWILNCSLWENQRDLLHLQLTTVSVVSYIWEQSTSIVTCKSTCVLLTYPRGFKELVQLLVFIGILQVKVTRTKRRDIHFFLQSILLSGLSEVWDQINWGKSSQAQKERHCCMSKPWPRETVRTPSKEGSAICTKLLINGT